VGERIVKADKHSHQLPGIHQRRHNGNDHGIWYIGSDRKKRSEIYKINEVVLFTWDITLTGIIDHMHTLVSANAGFQDRPPESLSIIGSNLQ